MASIRTWFRGESGWLLTGLRIVGLLISTGCSVLVARFLGPTEYGIYAAGLAVAGLALVFGPFGVDQLQLFHGLTHRRAESFTLIVAGASFAMSVLLAFVWPGFSGQATRCCLILGAAGALRLLLTPWLTSPQKDLLFGTRARREMAANTLIVLVSTAAAAFGKSAISVAAATLVAASLSVAWTRRRSTTLDRPETGPTPRLISGWPYAMSAAMYTVYFTVDSAIITAFRRTVEVGQYKAAYMWLAAATAVPAAINNDMLRARLAASKDDPHGQMRALRLARDGSFLFGAAASLLIYLVAPVAMRRLFGPGFSMAADVVKVLALAALPMYLSSWAANALVGLGRVKAVFGTQAVLCALNIAFNLAFVPRYGITAAAYVTFGTEVVGLILYACQLIPRLGSPPDLRVGSPTP